MPTTRLKPPPCCLLVNIHPLYTYDESKDCLTTYACMGLGLGQGQRQVRGEGRIWTQSLKSVLRPDMLRSLVIASGSGLVLFEKEWTKEFELVRLLSPQGLELMKSFAILNTSACAYSPISADLTYSFVLNVLREPNGAR